MKYKDKVILITGGTGSWGYELVKQMLKKKPKEIRIFSRGELAQVEMARYFGDSRLKFIIGDIRDEAALIEATRGVDYLFHLAALKHVPICEMQPQEAIKTNILGTQNVIKASIQNNLTKVIDVSTDKAVDPLNLYGMTKAVGEKLIIQANMLGSTTQFVCIRAGNVLGSNGSVVPFFINQIKKNVNIPITSREMTRYFMTLSEAIGLLFKGVDASIGGEIFVMRMPSYRIEDIADVLIEVSGKLEIETVEVGIRPGEKLDEVLISEHEAKNTFEYDDVYYLILPMVGCEHLNAYYEAKNLKKVTFEKYTSKDEVLGKEEAFILLDKGAFLKQL